MNVPLRCDFCSRWHKPGEDPSCTKDLQETTKAIRKKTAKIRKAADETLRQASSQWDVWDPLEEDKAFLRSCNISPV